MLMVLREGWLEPLTYKEMPNLRDIPESLFYKDSAGNIVNVPRSLGGKFWGYRTDISPIKIEKMEDLLDPRLKGQICWPDPIQDTNIQLITLALARGGDMHNLEPGWQFLKELAKSGNIGRVAKTEVEFINSMTSGETSVAIWNQGPWHKVSQNAPVKFLTKMPGEKAFKALLYQEGWVVLKSSKHKKAAKEYLNFFINPENNEAYNLAIGEAPANSKAKAGKSIEHLSFTKKQFDQYAMVPDYDYCAKNIDGWVKRFETEIIPLL
jgi:putative spermidine/putrescine transport system substrate-binding protein